MEVHTLSTPSHEEMLNDFLLPSATKAGFIVKVHRTKQHSPSGMYREEGWTETMRQKIEMLLEISKEKRGEIFIYSDCDILFDPKNINPEIATRDFGEENFAVFLDDVVQLCAGFMILRGGEMLERLFELVLSHIDEYEEDQTALNEVLKKFPVKAGILPRQEYFCIRQISGTLNALDVWNGEPFTIPENLKIFHANWTKGIKAKQDLLKFARSEIFEKPAAPLDTPVVFIIFNRPELTQKVFNEIRKAQPKNLYVIADGPRENKIKDIAQCRETRTIIDTIDWPCEVKKNYSVINLGCGKRISSGLDWVFDQCDQAIILEDDCVPSRDFFRFCMETLSHFKNDERVMSISGFSAPSEKVAALRESYYFSKFFGMWGWATWKRAWQSYDFKMSRWPEIKAAGIIRKNLGDIPISAQMERDLDNVYKNNGKRGIVDTWDFQFALAHFSHAAFAIKPKYNLVENIGIGDKEATHTVMKNKLSRVTATPLRFPLQHPEHVQWNKDEDMEVFKKYYSKSLALFKIKRAIKKIPFVSGIIKKVIYRV